MKVSKVTLNNIRGYENSEIELSPKINLVVGENNSGKTTILKSLLLLQYPLAIIPSDVRGDRNHGFVELKLSEDIKITHFTPQLTNGLIPSSINCVRYIS